MEIKIVPKVIQAEVYVTSDGVEHMHQRDAILHEKKLKAESLFEITYDDIGGQTAKYFVVSSQEELDLLYDYIYEVCDCSCIKSWYLDYIEFPALVVYTEEAELAIVFEKTYKDCKHVCEMYERMRSLKTTKQ